MEGGTKTHMLVVSNRLPVTVNKYARSPPSD
mgnify:CR=1 FL=1